MSENEINRQHRVKLASGIEICSTCDEEFSSLAQHWSRGACPWPDLSPYQNALVRGLVLGGAVVGKQYANPYCRLVRKERALTVWAMEELGWLSGSLYRIPAASSSGSETHVYALRTLTHPHLERYRAWYRDRESPSDPGSETEPRSPSGSRATSDDHPAAKSGSKHRIAPPNDVALPQTTVRTWVACSAYVAWGGSHDSRETGFSARDDARAARIIGLLEELDLDLSPSRRSHSVVIGTTATRRLLDYVGREPVPGVEHKWVLDRDQYDQIRREQLAEREWFNTDPRREGERPVEIGLYHPRG